MKRKGHLSAIFVLISAIAVNAWLPKPDYQWLYDALDGGPVTVEKEEDAVKPTVLAEPFEYDVCGTPLILNLSHRLDSPATV